MTQPAITVLMPVYNGAKFLPEAIDSILGQRFANFELLVIDDGSQDESASIIRSYTDPRIRFYQNETNLGITATLNKGIGLASAELIARMDADDISYANRLEEQFHFMAEVPDVVLLSAAVRVISESGIPVRVDAFPEESFYYNLHFVCWIYHSSVMFRKKEVIAIGMYQENYSEDFDLWWRIARNYRIAHLPNVLLDYRLSSQGLSMCIAKDAYEAAQHRQVWRNIHYYTGPGFLLCYEQVEMYRHHFGPVLQNSSVPKMLHYVRQLRVLTRYIGATPNPNLDGVALEVAYQYKRGYITHALSGRLKGWRQWYFVLFSGLLRQWLSGKKRSLLCRLGWGKNLVHPGAS